MQTETNSKTCPVEIAGGLDNSIRRFLQNPQKLKELKYSSQESLPITWMN